MTFKADSDDPRDSLSYKLRKTLAIEAREVLCTDPYLHDPSFVPLEECVRRSSVLFVGAPHAAYRTYDFGDTPVVDVWNATKSGIHVL
jgi:UDP-N-acetyl-D-mannosaminuronic acid dehydrogenase